jgi:short-subunit dehydrogenase
MEGLRQKINKLKLPVIITDIKPGFVKTKMAKGDGIFWAATPFKAAREIFYVIKRKKSTAYITKRWILIAWLLKIMPGSLYERL